MPEAPVAPFDNQRQGSDLLESALFEIKRVIAGQDEMLERVLVCLLAGGHLLLEGVPGLAKTLTIKTTAEVLGGTFRRVQFTPDLVPSDLVGTRIYRPSTGTFDTELGPVLCNFLLADEINRAPAKVQSALLEVMQERQVTIGGETHPVPRPFLVMATQNPIEQEGTYPLPEAQLDRFMLKVVVGYPSEDEEMTIAQRSLDPAPLLTRVLDIEQLAALQTHTAAVYVDPVVSRYAVDLAGGDPRSGEGRPARVGALRRLRREPARPDQHAARRPCARAPARPPLRAAAGRARARTRRAAPSARVELPGARRGRLGRPGHPARARLDPDAPPRPPAPGGCVTGLAALAPPRTPARPGPGPMPEGALRSLDLAVRRRVDSLLSGEFRSSHLGVATELAQVRPYEPGDDVRQIDWLATARTNEPHVRVHVAERALTTWLLLDRSTSMQFGTADRRKADVAEGVALALGQVASRRGNRLGVVTTGSGVASSRRPRQGRAGLLAALLALRLDEEPTSAPHTGLREGFEHAARVARQRALFVVVSDLRGPRDWTIPLARLSARHDVLMIEVRDPREDDARGCRRAAADRSRDGRAGARRHPQPLAPRSLRGGRRRRSCRGRRERAPGRRRSRRALDAR